MSNYVAFALILLCGEMEPSVIPCKEVTFQCRSGIEFALANVDVNVVEAEIGVLTVGGT